MPAIHWHEDDCQTADDVRRRAQEAGERRRRFFGDRQEPQIIYIEREPEIRYVQLTLQKMFENVAEAYEITPSDLATAICHIKKNSVDSVYKPIQISEIQAAVADCANLNVEEIISHRRHPRLIVPRQIAMALAKRLTIRSFPEIARAFDRDHSTVIHAVRKYEKLIEHIGQLARPDAPVSEWVNLAFIHAAVLR